MQHHKVIWISINPLNLIPDQETEIIANIVELVRRGVTLDGDIKMDQFDKRFFRGPK